MTTDTPLQRTRFPMALKLFLLLAAIFFITYASISLIVVHDIDAHLVLSAEKSQAMIASEKMAEIQQVFALQASNAQAWAKLDVMNDLVVNDVDKRILRTLVEMKRQYQLSGNIYAFNRAGTLVASSLAHRAPHQKMPVHWRPTSANGGSFVDKQTDPYTGRTVVAFSVRVSPAFARGRPIGYLVVTFPWSTVLSLLHSSGIQSIVLARDGNVIDNSTGRPLSARGARRLERRANEVSIRGATYLTGHATGLRGSFHVPWEIITLEPKSEALAYTRVALEGIAVGGVLLALPIGMLILWLTRWFMRPIARLTAAAAHISTTTDLSGSIEVTARDEIGALQIAFNRMITRLRHAMEELERLVMTDPLTGLPNRRAAEARLVEELARAKREQEHFSIGIGDLDNFKLVNDLYGHAVGDQVLQHVANIMRRALRRDEWLARWGGEEFIVFFHRAGAAQAAIAGERLRRALKANPFTQNRLTVDLTVSLGIATCSGGDVEIARLLAEADGCLYEAKIGGRDRIVAQPAASGILWKANLLQQALNEKRVVSCYQDIVALGTGTPVADEALARIVSPDGQLFSAAEFVEAAEAIDLIHHVDKAVTHQAVARCAYRLQRGVCGPEFLHFVNLSPRFLARHDWVQQLLEEAKTYCSGCNLDADAHKPIVLEITERHLLSDFSGLRRDLQPLLDFGFRLALDDFGSGYSSFLYLAELPVSFIKIEGWMVQNMRQKESVRRMVESIAILARSLGIITIAEWVEDQETADLLRDMRVDWGQGYYFGRPKRPTAEEMASADGASQ